MSKIVAKFGGSSLADAGQIEKVKNIIFENEDRKYIVVSAAGKRHTGDEKITDLLIQAFECRNEKNNQERILEKVRRRYEEIVNSLKINFDIDSEFTTIIEQSKNYQTQDYLASRGEYLSAKILSTYLKYSFIDMQDVIIFDSKEKVNYEMTYSRLQERIRFVESALCEDECDKEKRHFRGVVIPGFYGSKKDGEIVTFSRGGSDITGSLVARAIGADLYENWTDVSGVMFTDPRIAENVKPVDYITYRELRELSYMGASVLHQEAVYPVSSVGIPIHVLNTNEPKDKGTMIVSEYPKGIVKKTITGVAGKKGFIAVQIQKALLNEEIGFLSKLLQIFEKENISVEHCPTGIDTISVVLRSEFFINKKELIVSKIREELMPDVLNVEEGIALIAVVGEELINNKSVMVDIFGALSNANITIRMIDQGSSGINVIIGVSDGDYDRAIKALSFLQ